MTQKTVKKQKKREKKIEEVIEKGKEVLRQLHLNTFYKYREVGKLILESGYEKGKWYSKHRQRALDEWAISQRTFSRIVELGKLSEVDFSHVVANFPSVHAWANQTKEQTEVSYPPLPLGKFRTIVIDPPWSMKKILRIERPIQEEELEYPTLSLDDIKNFPLKDLVEEGCHIYLWTTHKHLRDALELFETWSVNYECLLTWVKNVGFTPYSWMYSTEHVLFGRIGSLELLKKGERLDFHAKVREHSRKPDEFYELVKRVSPKPRIDIFSRERREGFEQYGNEVNKFNDN